MKGSGGLGSPWGPISVFHRSRRAFGSLVAGGRKYTNLFRLSRFRIPRLGGLNLDAAGCRVLSCKEFMLQGLGFQGLDSLDVACWVQ